MMSEKTENARYTVIDRTAWEREPLFRYFTEEMPCELCLTVPMDAAAFLRETKRKGIKFYPAMLWAAGTVLNAHEEFRYRVLPEVGLVRFHRLSPSYAIFHPEDETFTRLVTEYAEDVREFHARFLADGEKYRDFRGIVPGMREDAFDASCLPWVAYSQFNLTVPCAAGGTPRLTPTVVWGKFEREGDRVRMPVTLGIHHAVADGFHVSRFFTELQTLLNAPLPGDEG